MIALDSAFIVSTRTILRMRMAKSTALQREWKERRGIMVVEEMKENERIRIRIRKRRRKQGK